MKKHEQIFETYKRNHKDENFEDAEKSKIYAEKNEVKKIERRAKRLLDNTFADEDNNNLTDEFENVSFKARKIAKNTTTHKSRLMELQKNDKFK